MAKTKKAMRKERKRRSISALKDVGLVGLAGALFRLSMESGDFKFAALYSVVALLVLAVWAWKRN